MERKRDVSTGQWLPGVHTSKTKSEIIKEVIDGFQAQQITDYWTLRSFGTNKFVTTKFGDVGNGHKVASLLTGEPQKISAETIDQIADILGWMPTPSQKIQKYKKELKRHGIVDYWTLRNVGVKFFKLEFTIVKKGSMEFINLILGRNTDARVLSSLEDLAKFFGWLPTEDDRKKKALRELAKHKIRDYWTLRYKFGVWFHELDFNMFGKGFGFLRFFLGDKIQNKVFHVEMLDTFAIWLGWMPTAEKKLELYRIELARHGITDHKSLTALGWKFTQLDFGIFGKGESFGSFILEGSGLSVRKSESLELVASKFGWQPEPDNTLELLAVHGITDYWALIEFGFENLMSVSFEGIGGIRALAGKILGRTISYIYPETLDEIATKLGWTPTDEQKKEKCCQLLKPFGIVDYWTLKYKYSNKTLRQFRFGGIGMQTNFTIRFLGVSTGLTMTTREKLANYLGWIPNEDEKIERYTQEMKKNGLYTYLDLFRLRYRDFEALDFGIFGRGNGFLKTVLEMPHILSKQHGDNRSVKLLEQLAQKLKLKK